MEMRLAAPVPLVTLLLKRGGAYFRTTSLAATIIRAGVHCLAGFSGATECRSWKSKEYGVSASVVAYYEKRYLYHYPTSSWCE